MKQVKRLSVKDQARQEVLEELNKELVQRYKDKLKELNAAKKITKNLEREIEDLQDEIDQELEDLNA